MIDHINYLAPVSHYKSYKGQKEIWIESHENYQKKSTRNKSIILSAQGPLTLSIPLQKGKHKQLSIKEVSIAYHEDWVKDHLKQIQLCYAKAAFSIFYLPEIEGLLQNRYSTLFELDIALLQWSFDKLGWDKSIKYTSNFIGAKPIQESKICPYPQVYDYKYGFTKHLSILDLLMNAGPEANYYL